MAREEAGRLDIAVAQSKVPGGGGQTPDRGGGQAPSSPEAGQVGLP